MPRLSAPAAAMCNGLAIHGYELDDLIASSIIHPAAAVIPAALAAAEAHGASGERLILGIVAGYEIMHRVAVAMGCSAVAPRLPCHRLTAPVAAAVAAGKVMDLNLAKFDLRNRLVLLGSRAASRHSRPVMAAAW